MVVEFLDDLFILGNIYSSNKLLRNTILFKEFEDQITVLLNSFMNAKLILGGDWNCINDPIKDCHPQRSLTGPYGEFNNLCLHLNCCDIWRLRNPLQIQFTWNNKDLSRRLRIDFWLISNDLIDRVKETKIEPSILTDHKIISPTLHIRNPPLKCNSNYWKLNNTLLYDKFFKQNNIEIINDNWRKAQGLGLYKGYISI